jgi:arylsulfatase
MGAVHQGIPLRSSRGMLRVSITTIFVFLTVVLLGLQSAQAAGKPNILVIFGDDIGQTNVSRYSHGLMGYMTPNIDSIGEDGMTFTDYYAENSCTAGR